MPGHIPFSPAPPHGVLERLVAASVDLLCVIDREGTLRWVNPAWEQLLGRSAERLLGSSLLELVHPADAEDAASGFQRVREDGVQGRFEIRLCCEDGRYRWMQWSVVPMAEGALYGSARDVTEQRGLAREAEERTRMLLMAEEVAGVGHWRIDLTRDSLTWSREMYRIHGLDPATYTPSVEQAVEAYHPEDRGLVSDHIRDAILLRKDFEFELRLVRPDGSIRTVLSRGKCEVSEDGRPLAVFGVFQDVTDRKRLQERVAHSERMATVGTLAAGVAHEINNPLTWVIANLDAVDRGLQRLGDRSGVSTDELGGMIEEAQQGADQVKRIVSDLLTYSRAKPECLEPIDVHDALDIAVNIATNQFKYRARLTRDYGHTPLVVADQSRLTQVIVNLVVNAAQAIPERRGVEGIIQLRTEVDAQRRVWIHVVDNGLGMPAAVRARVFDPFYTTKPVGVGTGLGLSISNNIIRSFGGEIVIDSREGEGTRVSVMLPAAAEEAEPYGLAEPDKRRIVVLDREGLLGRPLSRMLDDGYEIITLDHGRDALAFIDDGEAIDGILCDLELGDMSGLEFYRHVQRVSPQLSPRVAFIVGDEQGGDYASIERESLPFVTKPIEPSRLRELVDELVDA